MARVDPDRRHRRRAGAWLQWYYRLKYYAFRRERRPRDGRRGLLALQIDALSYADLRRAIRLGYCPTIARLLREDGYALRRWFCGLPSTTPYCQAGIFHGENQGIPAFRFYDKALRRVITCNAPEGVQYIRDRITAPGALAGGSSYVNLLDGDAQTVAFTVATRERLSVYRRLGGTRMLLLIALHPVRLARMLVQAVLEWVREEWERMWGEIAGRATHAEGIFPFLRVFTNVVVRELQTMAMLLDLYLGVPVIYSTFMQYDELAHHFGPTSRQALSDLRRTDARIKELLRMIRAVAGRGYDVVLLSDHGMTPAVSYRVEYGESLGRTLERILADDPTPAGGPPLQAVASFADGSEYADVGAQVLETTALVTSPRLASLRRSIRRARDWVRRHYGLRELVLPEKYRVDTANAVVVTYSSCLAQVYFAEDPRALQHRDILGDARRARVYAALLAHPGIGLLAVRAGRAIHLESRTGRATLCDGTLHVIAGHDPLEPYGTGPVVHAAVLAMVQQPNGGDIVLFGAYDGYDIVSFDDQVGGHGTVGGDQAHPFIIAPAALGLHRERLEDARDIHRAVMLRYMVSGDALSEDAPSVGAADAATATIDRNASPLSSIGSATAADRR
jgi:hypothetical protein